MGIGHSPAGSEYIQKAVLAGLRQPVALYADALASEPPDVKRIVGHYIETLPNRTESEDTRRTRRSHITQFLAWCIEHGVASPRELTRDTIETYLLEQRGRGLKQNTIAVKGGTIRDFLRFLHDRGHVSKVAKFDSPRSRFGLPHTISIESIRRILDACDDGSMLGFRDRALIEFLYSTGCRCGEAWRLNLADLDLDARTARVLGKGDRERLAYLTDTAAASLRLYLDKYRVPRSGANNLTAVFIGRNGRRLPRNGIWGAVARRADIAGVEEHVHPHSFRHSFATHMFERDVDSKIIQRLLGHVDPQSTDVYLRVAGRQLQAALDAHHPLSSITGEREQLEARASAAAPPSAPPDAASPG